MATLDIEICLTVYKKTWKQLKRALDSIPDGVSVRVDIDGGWEMDESMRKSLDSYVVDRFENAYLVHHDQNKGLGALHNQQIMECVHEYIQFLDADDWLENAEYLFNEIQKIDDKYLVLNHDVILTPTVFTDNGSRIPDYRNLNVARYGQLTYFCIPTIIFRTAFLQMSHGLRLDESGKIFEDVIFSIALTLAHPKALTFDVPYYCGNDIPDDDAESLSHPKDETRLINSTVEVIDEIFELGRQRPADRTLIYTRLVEEAIRLLRRNDLTSEVRAHVIDRMKPYKFFKQ